MGKNMKRLSSTRRRKAVGGLLCILLLCGLAVWLVSEREVREEETAVSRAPDADAVESSAPATGGSVDDISDVPIPMPSAGDMREAERDLDARKRVPVHPWHLERLENIAAETLEETAENLANHDDRHLAQSSISADAPVTTYWHVAVVTRLVRVRKLLEAGRRDRERVISILRPLFAEALEGYYEALAAERRKAKAAGGLFMEGTEELSMREVFAFRSLGATYILTELGDHESLPLLRQCYKMHREYPGTKRSPVPQAMTLYAMSRLVSSYPEERLSAKARGLKEECVRASSILRPCLLYTSPSPRD